MTDENERHSWDRQLYHEAGHAVASLALIDVAADIVVMNYPDENGKLQKHAQFKFNPGFQPPNPGDPNAIPFEKQNIPEQLMITAAGGIAEFLRFGDEAQGAVKDVSIINIWMLGLRKFAPAIHALAAPETEANFPETKKLLEKHWKAVDAIANAAYANFTKAGLGSMGTFLETVVLPEAEVRQLYNEHRPQTSAGAES